MKPWVWWANLALKMPHADETLGVVGQLSIKDATCWWNPGCGEPT